MYLKRMGKRKKKPSRGSEQRSENKEKLYDSYFIH